MVIVEPSAWRAQPWKNGAGTTHEIVRAPDRDDFAIRISVADVTSPAPFSKFPGIDRWLYLLAGGPVTIGTTTLAAIGDELSFPGEAELAATHVARPSRDLNIMIRRPSALRVARAGAGTHRVHAVFLLASHVCMYDFATPFEVTLDGAAVIVA